VRPCRIACILDGDKHSTCHSQSQQTLRQNIACKPLTSLHLFATLGNGTLAYLDGIYLLRLAAELEAGKCATCCSAVDEKARHHLICGRDKFSPEICRAALTAEQGSASDQIVLLQNWDQANASHVTVPFEREYTISHEPGTNVHKQFVGTFSLQNGVTVSLRSFGILNITLWDDVMAEFLPLTSHDVILVGETNPGPHLKCRMYMCAF